MERTLDMRFVGMALALSLTACQDRVSPQPLVHQPLPAVGLGAGNLTAAGDTSAGGARSPEQSVGGARLLDGSIPEPIPEAIHFAVSQGDLRAGRYTSAANFFQLRELWVRVEEPGMARLTSLRLVFLNPRGEPLYENRTFFSTDPNMGAAPMGQMAPQAVLPALPLGSGVALEHAVPIGGSVFERFPAPGTWTVSAQLDGRPPFTATLDVSYSR
jgi:hypothetical protein